MPPYRDEVGTVTGDPEFTGDCEGHPLKGKGGPTAPAKYDPPRGTQRPRGLRGGCPRSQNPQPAPEGVKRLSPPMG